jgi:hypothetical protein
LKPLVGCRTAKIVQAADRMLGDIQYAEQDWTGQYQAAAPEQQTEGRTKAPQ